MDFFSQLTIICHLADEDCFVLLGLHHTARIPSSVDSVDFTGRQQDS